MSFVKVISDLKSNLAFKRLELSNTFVDTLLAKNLDRFQEKIIVSIKDDISQIADLFKDNLSKTISSRVAKWAEYRQNTQLIPRNCRFMHTLGNNLVVVIEEEPKPRSLLLNKRLVEGALSTTRHYLSLPYVYFVFHFSNNKIDCSGDWTIQKMYTFWKNSALSSIDDVICDTVLSNTRLDGSVCMPFQFKSKSINDITKELISSYWAGEFNSDLSIFWNKKGLINKHLQTVENWVNETKENQSFILQCNWNVKSTLKEFLDKFKYDEVSETLVESIEAAINVCKSKTIVSLNKMIDQKFDRFIPKDVLLDITDIFNGYFDKLLSLLENLEKRVDKSENSFYNVTKVGHFWR